MASQRNVLLIGALGLTLAATWYAAGLEEGDGAAGDDLLARPQAAGPRSSGVVREAPPPPSAASPQPTVAAAPPAAQGSAQRLTAGSADLFAVRSWQPPPPPPPPVAAEAPPPPPVAPPLPFRYLGRMEDGPQITVFLSEGAQNVRVVRQGDQTGNYRIDEITPQGMRLTYLPLQQPQQLLFGSPN